MASNAIAVQRGVLTVIRSPVVEHFKTALFVYFVLKRLVQVNRHLRARGVGATAGEVKQWLSKVRV